MTKYTNRHTRIDTRKKLKHHSTERQPMFSTMAVIINFNCYLSSNGLLVAETDIQVQHIFISMAQTCWRLRRTQIITMAPFHTPL
jgi:hypothetical protein